MLSRFHLIPERSRRTDGQICYINIARQYAAIKMHKCVSKTHIDKSSRFSTNNQLYLANDTRQRHSYYGRRIVNRTKAFKWYQFQ